VPLERAKLSPKNPGLFPQTDWLVIRRSPGASEEKMAAAREEICRIYRPLVLHAIRSHASTPEEAEDLTQGFWLRFFQSNAAARADPAKGRFRDFLRGAIHHYLADQRDRAHARRRGGGAPHLSLDEPGAVDPAALSPGGAQRPVASASDTAWATQLLARAFALLEEKYARPGRRELFRALQPCLQEDDAQSAVSYARLAEELGRTEDTLRSEAARIRKQFRLLVAQELNRQVGPERFPEEWQSLHEILSGG
jgi:RNA polymerase sigma factor (sigma-70 family)